MAWGMSSDGNALNGQFLLIVLLVLFFAAVINSFWFWGNNTNGPNDPLNTQQYDWNFLLLIWIGVFLILIAFFLSMLDSYSFRPWIYLCFFGGLVIIFAGILYLASSGRATSGWSCPNKDLSK